MTDKKTQYPECEKLKEVAPLSQKIGDFLDWLEQDKGLIIAKYDDETGKIYSVAYSKEAMLADVFGIDLQKVEKDHQAILKSIQEINI